MHRTGNKKMKHRKISAMRSFEGRMCRLPQEEHLIALPPYSGCS
jgi:hypothetical protein